MGTRALAVALAAALAAAVVAASAAAPPNRGLFVPGKSLGGVTLGMTKAQVLAEWGKRHGVCRSCRRETWYFNYEPFTPEGAGVVFERGRAVHAFTVWRPPGWETPQGLRLGDDASEAARVYERGGWQKVGVVPDYALLPRGGLCETIFYCRRLPAS